MQVVVPLAGPDFVASDGTAKAELIVEGRPLLRTAIEGRSWWRRGQARAADLTVVLRDTPACRAFADRALDAWYPEARRVFLGSATGGAALSALAGVALSDPAAALCVDLADILYTDTIDAPAAFAAAPALGGIVPTFAATSPVYSYLQLGPDGEVVRAAEKQVISPHASAGTYFFRNAATYLDALAWSLRHPAETTHRGLFFVCPLMNGVLASGRTVAISPVDDVRDMKLPT